MKPKPYFPKSHPFARPSDFPRNPDFPRPKLIRISVFVSQPERYELHRRALDDRTTVNDFVHALVFPKGRKKLSR